MNKKVEDYVRSIPDFPEPGIIFRDVTSVIQSPEGLKLAIDGLTDLIGDTEFDVVVGPESRGFIFGVPVAYNTGKGFVPVRKKGKLPCETISADYELEYGTATIEMHKDAITPGQKVIIVDDLIATGGTTEAIIKLVEELGGEVVKVLFLMELEGLKGRDKIALWYQEKENIEYILGPIVESFDNLPEDAFQVTIAAGRYAVFESDQENDMENLPETVRMFARCVLYGWIREHRDELSLQRLTFERYTSQKMYLYVPVSEKGTGGNERKDEKNFEKQSEK